MSEFNNQLRVKKVLVILGVLFLFGQFQPGTKLQNLRANHTNQSHSVTTG
jgi:hypothetical protein